ncbi:putative dehydrogenase [Bacillus sp. TS-2]|nr:putative dehydrogenase [Bacillus sp. TS-2]
MNKEHILVTGASGGIGEAITRSLASPERTLFLHYFKNEEKVRRLIQDCENKGAEAYGIQANLLSDTGGEQLIKQIHVPVDKVVHNAGIDYVGLFTEMQKKDIDAVMNIHLHNPIFITQQLLPHMIQKKSGKIIFISSIWGRVGASCEVIYSAAKGGMNSFVKALAKELAVNNIQINAIAPGAIDTDMLSRYSNDEKRALMEEIPAGKLGNAKEIADLVAFLFKKESTYLNGQVISVDGAWY